MPDKAVREYFMTHVGLELRRDYGKVTFGPMNKVLFDGDINGAKEAFHYAREHYLQRQIALETEGPEAEGQVQFFRIGG